MSSPKIICITGGIGSGKSTFSALIEEKGHPVYYSDDRAKDLMNDDSILKNYIKELLGEEAYIEGTLNRSYISQKIFNDEQLKQQLEHLVHPVVKKDFEHWTQTRNRAIVFKESALVLETNDRSCEYIVSIVADEHIRIDRILKRNPELSQKEVKLRIAQQIDDYTRKKRSDIVIANNGSVEELNAEVDYLLSKVI